MPEKLIEVKSLSKSFQSRRNGKKQVTVAVDDVTPDIFKGETMGLLGESGCGKTTLGRTIIRLYEPSGGEIFYKGHEITHLDRKALKPFRRQIQTIFQDPYSSLNPHMDTEQLIGESLDLEERLPAPVRRTRILQMLDRVGLDAAALTKYPHEFSGGQRQRIGIARALITQPEFVLCDEPISALDVSIQAQVVNLLEALQKEMGLTYLFVAHDLSMMRHIAHRIAVMYLGRVVELAPTEKLYTNPLHPYTQALLSAVPIPDPARARVDTRIHLSGDLPSNAASATGCAFASRCPFVTAACLHERQQLRKTNEEDHWAACLRIPDISVMSASGSL